MKSTKIIFTLILFLNCGSVTAQIDNWLGDWEGDLIISGVEKPVSMRLSISKTESQGKWNWQIHYGETSELSRNYFLIATDDPKRFILDEDNSILLDFFYDNNAFYCTFKITNSYLTSIYHFTSDDMLFQVISSDDGYSVTTGGAGDVPEVISIPVFNTQRATLKRQ